MTYTETSPHVIATARPPAAIHVAGLGKRFGDHVVLDGLDLTVDAGSIYALLGPNGAGKSTLIRILTTLATADEGVAIVAGHDVVAAPRAVRAAIAVTGQSTAVDVVLTGRENLQMVGRILGLTARQARHRTAELLDRFDLTAAADQRAARYSGGMRRRLDLAVSLVVEPQVLFLDEPTTGLDARSRQQLWHGIGQLAAGGTTVLLTTQYLEEADALADRVGVLDGGRLVAEGTPAELKARVGEAVPALELPRGTPAAQVAAAVELLAAAGIADVAVTSHAPSMDDVYLALTERPGPASRSARRPTEPRRDGSGASLPASTTGGGA